MLLVTTILREALSSSVKSLIVSVTKEPTEIVEYLLSDSRSRRVSFQYHSTVISELDRIVALTDTSTFLPFFVYIKLSAMITSGSTVQRRDEVTNCYMAELVYMYQLNI